MPSVKTDDAMNRGDYLRTRAKTLTERGVPEARLNLEHLLASRLGVNRLDLLAEPDAPIPPDVFVTVEADAARLEAGEPLQYILGETPFHGIRLKTDRRALIPRPETEWLVEQVLGCASLWRLPEPLLADVGTGTGCIALALAAVRPAARLLAIDIDEETLSLAQENRAALGLEKRVRMRQGDLLEGVPPASLDAVVSNPPYIPSADCGRLERQVREREPRRALDGGADGLHVIRRLVLQAARCLKPGRSLWIEIGHDQGPSVSALLRAAGLTGVAIRRDWNGHERMACGWTPPGNMVAGDAGHGYTKPA